MKGGEDEGEKEDTEDEPADEEEAPTGPTGGGSPGGGGHELDSSVDGDSDKEVPKPSLAQHVRNDKRTLMPLRRIEQRTLVLTSCFDLLLLRTTGINAIPYVILYLP